MSAAAKSTDVIAREARRLAVRALDRANEAASIAESNKASIQALEARLDSSLGRILAELGDIRTVLTDVVKMLTSAAARP
jgi:hypothetical protein